MHMCGLCAKGIVRSAVLHWLTETTLKLHALGACALQSVGRPVFLRSVVNAFLEVF